MSTELVSNVYLTSMHLLKQIYSKLRKDDMQVQAIANKNRAQRHFSILLIIFQLLVLIMDRNKLLK